MQDNWQEFDRQIQSVLQDAGERVPGRVWRAVSARLGSAASAALWWRWAVPAFAAAAIVAGLFLTGTFDKGTSVSTPVDILAQTDIIPSSDDSFASGQEELMADLPARLEAPILLMRDDLRRAASSDVAEETPATAEEVSVSEPDLPVSAVKPAPDKKDKQNQDNGYDPQVASQWAAIELEESKLARKAELFSGLYAQGGVGGNDSNISYGGNGISRLAPGIGSMDAGISETGQSTYGVPFTIGIGARLNLTDKLAIGTGVDYSLLTRTFLGSYNGNSAGKYEGTISHSVSYIGVPLNVYYRLLQSRDELVDLYAWAGGEAEYCISNKYRLMRESNNVVPDKAGGFQFSAALGLGVEFKLSESLGLYADPAVRYYFHGDQPKSIRTDKPLMFSFDAGLRFNF